VQSAGAIDPSLNVTMNLETLQQIGNRSRISGTSSGGTPGIGFVEIKVGGGDWQQAEDVSTSGDWSSWDLKLQPHVESGNSTVYSRLVISDDQMSPVDARRVILIDGQNDSNLASGETTLGIYVFLLLLLTTVSLLGWMKIRTR
jgi:hypothetical protein